MLNWWQRKTPATRRLAVAGFTLSTLLFGFGLLSDMRAWGMSWPFLTSTFRDLLRVTLLGTVGVLALDEYRSWTDNWPEIRARAPEIVSSTNQFMTSMSLALGLGKRGELQSLGGLLSAHSAVQRLGELLFRASNCFEGPIDWSVDQAAMVDAKLLRDGWYLATAGGSMPTDEQAIAELQSAVDDLLQALDGVAPYTSVGTREEIGRAKMLVSLVPGEVAELLREMRPLATEESITQAGLRSLHMLLYRCSSTLSILRITFVRLEYEHKHGRPFPGRS